MSFEEEFEDDNTWHSGSLTVSDSGELPNSPEQQNKRHLLEKFWSIC